MKILTSLLLLFSLILLQEAKGAKDEILNILNTANDLPLQDINALRPLFRELQRQYDSITKALEIEGQNDIVPWQSEQITEAEMEEFVKLLEGIIIKPSPTVKAQKHEYDTKLPTLEELIENVQIETAYMTKEQITELEDLQLIMQQTLDEAQIGIDKLVQRALQLESKNFSEIKHKALEIIYKALRMLHRYSSKLRRSGYCVYSHVPELNESLENLNAGVLCYNYTRKLTLNIENEVVHTVSTIRKNVFDLAKVYKEIAQVHSLFGKILTGILNLPKIIKDVRQTLAVATKALDDYENQLPIAASKAMQCGKDFSKTLPFMINTVNEVTNCITYVEPNTNEYEFLLPESERNFDHFNDLNN